MKKSVLFFVVISLLSSFFISCNSDVPSNQKNDNDEDVKPYVLDLSKFGQPDNDMGTYDTQTHIISINDSKYLERRGSTVYCWLDYLDASEYNCVRVKYEALDYGFVFNIHDDKDYSQQCYFPSSINEFLLPFDDKIDKTKLKGVSLSLGLGTREQTVKIKEISFEYVENVQKTDVWATNKAAVIDTASEGTYDDSIYSWDYVKKLGVGLNFSEFATAGTTYEMGHDFYGMGDGYAKAKKEKILSIKNRGFSTIRLMLGNGYHMLDENYTIDPEFLAEMKKLVDWAIEEGMYVIITDGNHYYGETDNQYITVMKNSVHYTGYTVSANASEDIQKKSEKFIEAVWKQMSAAFNNSYDEHLIFELLNEPHDSYHPEHKFWEQPDCATCAENMKLLNKYNQICLDTIRASGGNNAKRFVLVPGLGTYWESITSEYFEFPEDPNATDKLIPVIHSYPQNNVKPWSNQAYSQSIKSSQIDKCFTLLDKAFFSKHIPVYISETGCSIESPGRMDCMKDFCTEVTKNGRSCSFAHHDDTTVVDKTNTESGGASFILYDKFTNEWLVENKEYLDMIFEMMKD